ncbi:hypothetical protein NP493_94g03000 [Ridgeia piscesae]|uniref:Vacuolar protein sorting-associated protein 18 homolog n=1 Tax=Ridgeia piscesae TaxID=27915 RepID=A0AAD9P832_RIDPI|nr:hypothetical protein NP493_94g03000 [Ridgeia piscesae]
MANLIDQYHEASSRAGAGGRVPHHQQRAPPEPIGAGFINARLEDDTPIFNKQRISFTPRSSITHMCVANNILVMAMSGNILLRNDLEHHPDQPEELEISKSLDDSIHNIYLDPTGRHLIVSMKSTENFYLSRNSSKPRALAKLKGNQISAVGWNREKTNNTSTGEILLGTTKGLIIETEIISSEDSRFFQASLEQHVKQLSNLGKEQPVAVTGVVFEKGPAVTQGTHRYFIMVTLPGRLYQFIGCIPDSPEPPVFQHVFSKYEDVPERFLELPGNFGYSCLQFFHDSRGAPKSFAWMTGPGIYYGNIDMSGDYGEDSVTIDTSLIEYPGDEMEEAPLPLSIVLTEFHLLILYPNRLKAICVLNQQLIYDEGFPDKFGKLVNMCKDPVKGTVWAFSKSSVYKYKIIREARDVWQMYLDQEQFELAKKYCKDNPAHTDKVLTKQAEFFFKEGRYEKSAETYALTQHSFEEVTLKFIRLEQKEALKKFLINKLAGLKTSERTQTTMIVSWLTEIFLNQMGRLKEQDVLDQYGQLQDQFRAFLSTPRVKECVSDNRSLVYELIASHGDVEDMVFFAELMRDFERVITHHLQQDDYPSALQVLSKQDNTELFYKFSPLLMQNIPKETVDVWIAKRGKLESRKLIPALVQYDHLKYRAQGNEAIRYLEFCVQALGVREQAIHNYLLSLYAKLQPDKLMKYLNFQGQDPDLVCYDLKYALRLCLEHDHKEACVHIYSTMGLYEEAVHLALQVDVDLAKMNADKPEEDEELRKKLWLEIARHVVEKEKDIKRAMEFQRECDLLKIEDILPFFPDFVTIDHFKDAICTSLEEYNEHIETLKDEMEEATKSAQEIRTEIQSFRNKYTFIKAQDKCSCCGFPLMTQAFYAFPCTHKFHSKCLTEEVRQHLSASKCHRIDELQRKLSAKSSTPLHSVDPELAKQSQADKVGSCRCRHRSFGVVLPSEVWHWTGTLYSRCCF